MNENIQIVLIGFLFRHPHVTTLDQRTYTFNGLGEFWLIRTMNDMNGTNAALSVQCRTEIARNLANANLTSRATIFSGFAMRAGNGTVVEVLRENI